MGNPLASLIPVDNPTEALAFCQKLAAFLAEQKDSSTPESEAPPEISVVIPLMNEEGGVKELLSRLVSILAALETEYEIVLVDDGSTDKTVSQIQEFARHNDRIIVLELSRNFGHQMAITAGLDYTRGNVVVVMDGDLQDPPEMIPAFFEKMKEGFDVVYGIRESRKEGFGLKLCYTVFYRVLHLVATVHIPLDSGDFCIMTRAVVNELRKIPERNRFIRGIRSWLGFKQTGLPYSREARFADLSKYSLARLINLALDGLISFSFRPLRAITVIGFFVSCASVLLASFYLIQKISIGLTPPGFATTIVAILFLAGMQLLTIGLVGEYVGRIFVEVKRRPMYVIRNVWRKEARK